MNISRPKIKILKDKVLINAKDVSRLISQIPVGRNYH